LCDILEQEEGVVEPLAPPQEEEDKPEPQDQPASENNSETEEKLKTDNYLEKSSIEGDPVRDDLVLLNYMANLESIISYSKDIWRRTGCGEISLLRAAWLTSAAYNLTQRWHERPGLGAYKVRDLLDRYGDAEQPSAVSRGKAISDHWKTTFERFNRSPHTAFSKFSRSDGLSKPLKTFETYRKSGKGTVVAKERDIDEWYQRPPMVLSQATTQGNTQTPKLLDGEDGDEEDYGTELETYYQHILAAIHRGDRTGAQKRLYLTAASPVGRALQYWLQHPEKDAKEKDVPVAMDVPFGLCLLQETTKSYMWATGSATNVDCRSKAISFAKELLDSIKTLERSKLWDGTVDKPHPLGDLLLTYMKPTLESFINDTTRGLWAQAPWNVASQMYRLYRRVYLRCVNITLVGLPYVALVVYAYQAVRSIHAKSPTDRAPPKDYPLFDHLVGAFAELFCLDDTPLRNLEKG
jgi:hypothetical protein